MKICDPSAPVPESRSVINITAGTVFYGTFRNVRTTWYRVANLAGYLLVDLDSDILYGNCKDEHVDDYKPLKGCFKVEE